MSLGKQLTLALLLLAVVPSTLVSIIALRQVLQVNQLWQGAGMEEALASSVAVAKQSLHRMEVDLDYASDALIDRWHERAPDFRNDPRERLYVSRFLGDVGYDFVQVYARDSTGYHLESAVYPEKVLRTRPADLSAEVAAYQPGSGPLRSMTGALADVRDVAGGRRVAVGFQLAPDFFGRLSELQLGLGTYRALALYARVFRTYLIALLAGILSAVAGLAVLAAWLLSRRLAGPVMELSQRLEGMGPMSGLETVPEPEHATPEVRNLSRAVNSLTRRLSEAQADLLRAERVAGSAQVARHVAHEIKNELATLRYATQRVERRIDPLPEPERGVARESLAAMRQEFEALEEMAETFSELGRMGGALEFHPVHVNGLVRELFAMHAESPHRFELDLAEELPPISGDARALRRLISNLLKNASEATPAAGSPVVRTRAENGWVALEIQDRGPGMSAEILARAFDPGFSTKGRGSGVGLFLARAIVEQHGGTISLESREGGGSTARLLLPPAGSEWIAPALARYRPQGRRQP